jgi:hypothetical protein
VRCWHGGGARRWRGGIRGECGRGRKVEAHMEDVEEEQMSAGLWWGNDRVRVWELGHT